MLTDFHTHILPGIDDGSQTPEESLALLRMQAEQGVGRVVLTPHFYPRYESPDSFLEKRERALAQLKAAIAGSSPVPELVAGAEVYFFRGMSESDVLSELTVGSSNCILIEMPPAPWPEEVLRELAQIREKRGLTPVIAHLDRYIAPLRNYGLPKRLAQMPVLVQVNGSFFLDRRTEAMALRMLKRDQIQLLGSDCHNTADRKPNLGQTVQRVRQKLGDAALRSVQNYESQIFGDAG